MYRYHLHDCLNAEDQNDFLFDDHGAHNRSDVLSRARRIASRLQEQSPEEVTRVAIFCRSPRHALEAFYGCLAAGACAVPIHIATPPLAVAHLIADSGATACLTDLPVTDLPDAFNAMALIHTPVAEFPAASPPAEPFSETRLAALLYTSGTTGKPKGVVISRSGLRSMAEALSGYVLDTQAQDTVLLAAPLSNIFGVALAAMALCDPVRLSLLARLTPMDLYETMRRDRVTLLAGVPMMAGILLRAAGDTPDPLPNLRRALLAGTWLEPDLAQAFSARFECEVRTGLGMTELPAIAIGVFNPKLPRGAVGYVSPGTEIRIVDEAMYDLPDGTPGEALVRGPMLTLGYWTDQATNTDAFVDGWFRTGDIVVRQPGDGCLVLVDRKKEIIKTAGNTVFPSEVEATVISHPSISQAALVGLPQKKVGEILTIVYSTNSGQSISADELRTWCRDRLISWKVPRKYVEIAEMPMTPSGKISKAQLLERLM